MESDKKQKYNIKISKKIEKFVESLSEPYYSAIKKAILSLENDPRPAGCKRLVGQTSYRIRVADYRIVYNIFDNIVTVEVVKVNHRKEVYKKR